jgi:hypothetical protein
VAVDLQRHVALAVTAADQQDPNAPAVITLAAVIQLQGKSVELSFSLILIQLFSSQQKSKPQWISWIAKLPRLQTLTCFSQLSSIRLSPQWIFSFTFS